MLIDIEETTRYEVEIDPEKFLTAFPAEWNDWLDGSKDSYGEQDMREFIIESVHIMGAYDFVADEWVKNVTCDHDLGVSVRR